jgi:hypothetical protein
MVERRDLEDGRAVSAGVIAIGFEVATLSEERNGTWRER